MSILQIAKMMSASPCSGGPTVTGVTVALQSVGSCPSTPATWRVNPTISGSLGTRWELKYYICISSSAGCTPAINFYTGTDTGYQDYSHTSYEANSGSGATTYYANARVEVVPVGKDFVCDSANASQASRNPYRGCFD